MKAGDRFGRYQVKRRLAYGGMAEIWLATQKGVEGFEKEVVLKTIMPNLADQDNFKKMFVIEALLTAQLNHPNIVQIFDLGQVGDRLFIAMEYVDGLSLRDVCRHFRKHGRLVPPWFVLRAVAEICDGLQYAHDFAGKDGKCLGLIHRDITPENLMVSFRGGVKILDFGVAKGTQSAFATETGGLKGKSAYFSPEQIRGKIDRRVDIYALGVTLYEMITGQQPYRAETEYLLLTQILEGKAKRPRDLGVRVPERLERVIMMAMHRDVERRYQQAADVGNEIRGFLRSANDNRTTNDLGRLLTNLPTTFSNEQPGAEPGGSYPLSEGGTHPKPAITPASDNQVRESDLVAEEFPSVRTPTTVLRRDTTTFDVTGLDDFEIDATGLDDWEFSLGGGFEVNRSDDD